MPGLTKRQLIARTARLGWPPTWRRLPRLQLNEVEAFGFALTVDGMSVPLIDRETPRDRPCV
ncbi:hypothetical protein DIE19_35660 [Burkholderia sp. Bp9126]|nr:hypothetical protein DIE19_35660 [Burkholderia sp. Bp9126]